MEKVQKRSLIKGGMMNKVRGVSNEHGRNSFALFLYLFFILVVFPLSASADEVSGLPKVLAAVEKHSPALLAAIEQSKGREASKDRSFGEYLGEVDLFGTDSHFNNNRIINPISPPIMNIAALEFDDDIFSTGIRGKIPLDISGKIRAAYNASKYSLKGSVWREKDVLRVLLLQTARLYRGLERLAGEKNALSKQLSSLSLHVEIATTAFEAGRIARVEKLRLVAEKERVKGALARLKGQELALRAKIASLAGTERFLSPVSAITPVHAPRVSSKELSQARPDYLAFEEELNASHYQKKARERERLPQLSGVGAWSQNQGYNGDGDDNWVIGLEASLPLFDGGKRRAAVREAHFKESELRFKLQALKEAITAEIEGAKASWEASSSEVVAAKASLEAARETSRVQGDRFKEGRISAADLVDAEAALSTAESGLSAALAGWWLADDELRAALGYFPNGYESKNINRWKDLERKQ